MKGMPPEKKAKTAVPEEKTDIREMGELDEGSYPYLRVVAGPGRGAIYPLQPGKNLLGRSEMAHIMLDDSSISREHAELDVRAEGALVRDLKSRNGTLIQGRTISSDTPITHGQRLKVGIYDFQYLTGPADLPAEDSEPEPEPETEGAAQETVVDSEAPSVDEAPVAAPPEEVPQAPELPEELPPEMEGAPLPAPIPEPGPEPEAGAVARPGGVRRFVSPLLMALKRIPRRWRFIGGGLVLVTALVMAGLSYWPAKGPGVPPEVPTGPIATPEPHAVPGEIKMAVPEYIPVFLDFSSIPISAEVFFGEESVGATPFRMSAHLQYGKTYEVKAQFKLEEISEVIEEKKRFSLGADQQVVPIKFEGPIGHMKIKSLPRGIDLYLEAFFSKDPHQAKPVKFNEIIFGKPIYLPYGRYVMELRQSRQLSSSKTFINEVVYRREFKIDAETSVYELAVKEKDLKVFPATIRSVPEGADFIVDGKSVGKTPYEGDLAIGEHKLVLKKEGYFEHQQDIRVDLNTFFILDVQLKTSQAGKLINDARAKIRQRRYKDAINLLIDSLKENPTSQEVAESHYLIGQSYLYLKSYDESRDYFKQAMRHEMFRYPARLGIAEIYYVNNERIKALQVLTEVLVAAKRDDVRSRAGKLFQQISPFKSVLYVMSEPEGATVTINEKAVAVKTPLLLHDLMVGTYRLYFHIPGYEPHMAKVDLGVSEFKPLVVRLQLTKPVK